MGLLGARMSFIERFMPAIGDCVGERYALEEEIGRGGFGVVYRAHQKGLNEDVAVKILLPHVMSNEDAIRRFQREVAVAKGLRHPNTIRLLDTSQTDHGLPFYVMEFVNGLALNDALRSAGRLSEARTRRIIVQVLNSLAEAHSKGVVHRDLKPGNILTCEVFGEPDFVKVLDFGIAKALTEDGTGYETQTGLVLGTPSYMSPEQAVAQRDIDGRSDLYAVGLIIAECLSGRPVVVGHTPLVVVAQHASKTPLSFASELVTSPLWPIICRATAKNRDDRYADASQMRAALESVQNLSDVCLLGPVSAASEPQVTPASFQHTPDTTDQLAVEPVEAGPYDPLSLVGRVDHQAHTMSEKRGARSPSGKVRWALAVVALLAVGVWVIAKNDNEPTKVDVAIPSATVDALVSEPAANNTVEELTNLVDAGTGQPANVTPPVTITVADQELVFATATAFAIADARLQAALPLPHAVRFGGTSEVIVTYQDQTWGITPFEVLLPRLDAEIELSFERDGYRDQTQTFSLLDGEVSVELRRDRPFNDEDRPDPVDPSPFGNTEIYPSSD